MRAYQGLAITLVCRRMLALIKTCNLQSVVNHKPRSGRKFAVASTWDRVKNWNTTTAFAFAAGASGGNCKSFDGKTVIDNLNLTINNGEFLTLLGPLAAVKPPFCALLPAWKTSTADGSISKITISLMFRRKTATSIPYSKATPCFRIWRGVSRTSPWPADAENTGGGNHPHG